MPKSCFEAEIPNPIDYESIVGKELWDEYKERKQKLLQELVDNQKFCDILNEIVMEKMKKKNG